MSCVLKVALLGALCLPVFGPLAARAADLDGPYPPPHPFGYERNGYGADAYERRAYEHDAYERRAYAPPVAVDRPAYVDRRIVMDHPPAWDRPPYPQPYFNPRTRIYPRRYFDARRLPAPYSGPYRREAFGPRPYDLYR